VQLDDTLQEFRLRARHVLDGLARNRFRQETDEVARMAGMKCDADLAIRLETADAGSVPRARIDHDEGTLLRVQLDPLRLPNADKAVIDRPIELSPVHDDIEIERQNMRRGAGGMLPVLVPALAHHIQQQDGALEKVRQVIESRIGKRHCIRFIGHREFLWLVVPELSQKSAAAHRPESPERFWTPAR
jgi:hypothetical protein